MATEKQLAGNQRRTLRTMREKLLRMAADWDGVDQFNLTRLTEIADLCEEVAAEQVADDSQIDGGVL